MQLARAAWGVGLVSAAALAFEIALARICAALLQYHVSFAVVSLAVLGIGLGGFTAAWWMRRGARAESIAGTAVVAIAPATLLALVALMILPFARHWPLMLLLVLPAFATVGAFQSVVIQFFAARAPLVYAADLGGGAMGALLAVGMLAALGGPVQATLVFALLTAGGAWWWTRGRGRRGGVALVSFAAALVLAVAHRATGLLEVRWDLAPNKLITRMLKPTPAGTPRLVPGLAHWDAYSRVDVIELDSPRGVQRLVFIDGETPTPMLPVDPLAPNAAGVDFEDALAALPFRLRKPETVLAIGSGGGHDVVLALRFGAAHVDAVEFNPGVLATVAAAREFTGDVYGQAGVRLHHAEGRLFARTAPAASYDLVILALAQSLAGNLQEYALSENYLYTREAFEAYLRVLRPGGTLALLTSDGTVQRKLMLSAIAVLDAAGEAGERCVAALESPSEVPYNRVVLVRKVAFSPAEIAGLEAEIEARGYGAVHRPEDERPPVTSKRMRLATDSRPFFFHLEPGTPAGLRLLLGIAAALMVGAWCALAAPGVRAGAPRGVALGAGAYFGLLGLAFLMVEVLAMQLTLRVIGFPALNLALIIATFLVAAGCGSAASTRVATRRGLQVALAALGVTLILFVPMLNAWLEAIERLPLVARCMAVALALFPFGFAMGIPFPAGLRLLAPAARGVIPWLWGMNGVASIAGSAAIVAVVLETGLSRAGLLPASLYLLAILASRHFMRSAM